MSTEAEQARAEIDRRVDWLIRDANGAEGRFTRCREAANVLAAAVYDFTEDPEGVGTDALRVAWSRFMSLDSGNFGALPEGVGVD